MSQDLSKPDPPSMVDDITITQHLHSAEALKVRLAQIKREMDLVKADADRLHQGMSYDTPEAENTKIDEDFTDAARISGDLQMNCDDTQSMIEASVSDIDRIIGHLQGWGIPETRKQSNKTLRHLREINLVLPNKQFPPSVAGPSFSQKGVSAV